MKNSVMKGILFLGVLLLTSPRVSLAQFAGGAGANVESEASPTAREQRKRQERSAQTKDDGTSTFIEASILMNVKADEYVAVFGVMEEGKTPEEASTKMDATISNFKQAVKALGVADGDVFVDFVAQNRLYAFRMVETANKDDKLAREELAGFELKKNVSIHFADKTLVDRLAVAAARSQIFDLIKVDYVVRDKAAIAARLQAQTIGIIKRKADLYQTQLGIRLPAPTQVLADEPSVYYPVEQYSSYTAASSESINVPYDRNRAGVTVQNARKSRLTYFAPLTGDGFDTVINPIIIEPIVQFTTYMKVKYEAQTKRKK